MIRSQNISKTSFQWHFLYYLKSKKFYKISCILLSLFNWLYIYDSPFSGYNTFNICRFMGFSHNFLPLSFEMILIYPFLSVLLYLCFCLSLSLSFYLSFSIYLWFSVCLCHFLWPYSCFPVTSLILISISLCLFVLFYKNYKKNIIHGLYRNWKIIYHTFCWQTKKAKIT